MYDWLSNHSGIHEPWGFLSPKHSLAQLVHRRQLGTIRNPVEFARHVLPSLLPNQELDLYNDFGIHLDATDGALKFSKAGSYIVCSHRKGIKCFSTSDPLMWKLESEIKVALPVNSVDISPCERFIVSSRIDCPGLQVHYISETLDTDNMPTPFQYSGYESDRKVLTFNMGMFASDVKFGIDGKDIFYLGGNYVKKLNIQTLNPLSYQLNGFKGTKLQMKSASGEEIFIMGRWAMQTVDLRQPPYSSGTTIGRLTDPIVSFDSRYDERYVISGTRGGSLYLWDIRRPSSEVVGNYVHCFLPSYYYHEALKCQFSPNYSDQRLVCTASTNILFHDIYTLESSRPIIDEKPKLYETYNLTMHPHELIVVTSSLGRISLYYHE